MPMGDGANWSGGTGVDEGVEIGVETTMSPATTRATVSCTLVKDMDANQIAEAVADAWNSRRPIDFVHAIPPARDSQGYPSEPLVTFVSTRPGTSIRKILVEFEGESRKELATQGENAASAKNQAQGLEVARKNVTIG